MPLCRLKPMHPYVGIIRIRFPGIISAFNICLKAPRASIAAKIVHQALKSN